MIVKIMHECTIIIIIIIDASESSDSHSRTTKGSQDKNMPDISVGMVIIPLKV